MTKRQDATTVILFMLSMTGCADDSISTLEAPLMRVETAIKSNSEVFVFSDAPSGTSLEPAFAHQQTDFWWARIEIPLASREQVNSTSGLSVQLSDSNNPVVFAQNYPATWSPDQAKPPIIGWLREQYVAGEKGLQGHIMLRAEGAKASVSFYGGWSSA